MVGDHLDLTNDACGGQDADATASRDRFLGVRFACCGVYTRIYVNQERTAYLGYCLKCSKPVQFRIGPDGTDSRFFTVY